MELANEKNCDHDNSSSSSSSIGQNHMVLQFSTNNCNNNNNNEINNTTLKENVITKKKKTKKKKKIKTIHENGIEQTTTTTTTENHELAGALSTYNAEGLIVLDTKNIALKAIQNTFSNLKIGEISDMEYLLNNNSKVEDSKTKTVATNNAVNGIITNGQMEHCSDKTNDQSSTKNNSNKPNSANNNCQEHIHNHKVDSQQQKNDLQQQYVSTDKEINANIQGLNINRPNKSTPHELNELAIVNNNNNNKNNNLDNKKQNQKNVNKGERSSSSKSNNNNNNSRSSSDITSNINDLKISCKNNVVNTNITLKNNSSSLCNNEKLEIKNDGSVKNESNLTTSKNELNNENRSIVSVGVEVSSSSSTPSSFSLCTDNSIKTITAIDSSEIPTSVSVSSSSSPPPPPPPPISITYKVYENERQMPDIMRLIQKDLSEPYSIYTYRYFIHNWPELCYLAMHNDLCVGAIVCKLDLHRHTINRGYIAMLAVDKDYRKLKIGTNLVQKAITAMLHGDADEIALETEITNIPALRLYENLGFVRDKRLFDYYLNGVDALRLKLWFR